MKTINGNPERERLYQARVGIADWRGWGPYLSDRQWGTVREDYSAQQTAEEEFLSPYGIRALSKIHRDDPFVLSAGGMTYRIGHEPAESETELFGSNSNWRGPIWFPVYYLIVRASHEYRKYVGKEFTVEIPTGSGRRLSLDAVADELARRLVSLFTRDESGRRPFASNEKLQSDARWREYALFYEYFHGDTGAGLGAAHQTGWPVSSLT